MKRYGNLYKKIYDIDNLRLAHKNAKRDKKFYREVKMVDSNEDYYLTQIQQMLINKTYVVSEYKESTINDKGKDRELMKLPYYPDRIIQWAILLQIESIFISTFCSHSCASICNRGVTRATNLTSKYLKDKENTLYCLQFDINKFYPSVNQDIMKMLLRKKFKDKDLLELLDLIVDSYPKDKGIPIGSYLSQFLANFYLTYFDHWLKEDKKCKYVVRYMDDVIILSKSKEHLHKLFKDIQVYLKDNLDLTIKSNWQIFPVDSRGIDFIGYRHFHDYKLLRKKTCKRFKKVMNSIKLKTLSNINISYSDWCSINSYNGWLKWCDGYRLDEKYIRPLETVAYNYYNENIKNKGGNHCERLRSNSRFA